MNFIPYVLCLLTGVLNAIHSGTNAQLTQSLERPWWAGVFVCVISGAVLLVAVAFSREGFPSVDKFIATPWWAWLGTAIAAVPIIATLLFAGRLGGAAFNGLVVTGTIVFSLVLDQFGLLGFEVHHVNIERILGACLMLGGLALICVF